MGTFITKEEKARRIYKTYEDQYRDSKYSLNNEMIKHYKKSLIIHSILILIAIFFLIFMSFSVAFYIWVLNLIHNTYMFIKHYKLFEKERLSTIELDKEYYPERCLRNLRIKKFKKLT